MTAPHDELTLLDAFLFGMDFGKYYRGLPVQPSENAGIRMMRALVEVADGETVLTETDAEVKRSLPGLTDEFMAQLIEMQAGVRVKQKMLAEHLAEVVNARSLAAGNGFG